MKPVTALATIESRRTPIVLGPGSVSTRSGASTGAASPLPPTRFRTLAEAVRGRADEAPDAVAFHFVDVHDYHIAVTNAEVRALAEEFARLLQRSGIRPGDCVLLCFDTGPEVIGAFLGSSLVGAVPALTEPPHGLARMRTWRDSVERMVRVTSARALLVTEDLREAAGAIVETLPELTILSRANLTSGGEPLVTVDAADLELAFMQFTSGTTGASKAVRITHRALIANARAIAQNSAWTTDETMVSWLPLFHDMGLVGAVLTPYLHGVPAILLSPLSFLFRPARWLWAVSVFGGTASVAPNFAYELCVRKIDTAEIEGLDLRSWKRAYNGAEFIHAQTLSAFFERFGMWGFPETAWFPVYGMAETTLAAAFPEPGAPPRVDVVHADELSSEGHAIPAGAGERSVRTQRFVSVGRALIGHSLRVVDATGKEVPERTCGEIVLVGPSLAGGYIGDDGASASTFRDDGFHTGDFGYVADGDLFVCGRIKDLIIKAGRNYSPEALELAAARVPEVRAGCVVAVGIENSRTGTEDVVVAFETRTTHPDALRALCREVEARVHADTGLRPEATIPLPPRTLPKTSSGKVPRSTIRRLVQEGALVPSAEGK